jgi:hypothetical protein
MGQGVGYRGELVECAEVRGMPGKYLVIAHN